MTRFLGSVFLSLFVWDEAELTFETLNRAGIVPPSKFKPPKEK